MGPSEMTSELCLSKQACQPIGGQSVWSYTQEDQSKPVVLIATALDSVGDFYGQTDGGQTGVTLAMVLTLAKALSGVVEELDDVEVLFAFFQGENWGRVGSRKFIDDLQHFKCERVVNASKSVFNNDMCYSPLKVCICSFVYFSFLWSLSAWALNVFRK